MIIAGGGVLYSEAARTLQDFAAKHAVPVAETQAGKSSMPWDHPQAAGSVGVTGSSASNTLVREADVPFREAHHITGRAVKLAEERGCKLDELTVADLKAIDERIDERVFDVLSVDASVRCRRLGLAREYGPGGAAGWEAGTARWPSRRVPRPNALRRRGLRPAAAFCCVFGGVLLNYINNNCLTGPRGA